MPEIPLSVGSKLELLLSLPNFRILPRTLTHLSAYAYCPEEVRQGHVISKIPDAGTRESMAFCIHFLEASSALERQANQFTYMFLPSQTTVSASRPGEGPLLKWIIGS